MTRCDSLFQTYIAHFYFIGFGLSVRLLLRPQLCVSSGFICTRNSKDCKSIELWRPTSLPSHFDCSVVSRNICQYRNNGNIGHLMVPVSDLMITFHCWYIHRFCRKNCKLVRRYLMSMVLTVSQIDYPKLKQSMFTWD